MEANYILLYLYGIVDNIQSTLLTGGILIGFYIMWCLFYNIEQDKSNKIKSITPLRIITMVLLFLIAMFVPSKESLIMIGGYSMGKSVIQSETSQKFQKLINLEIDKKIKQLQ